MTTSYISLAKSCSMARSFCPVSLRACRERGGCQVGGTDHAWVSPLTTGDSGRLRQRVGAHLGAPRCRQEEGSAQQDGDAAEPHGRRAGREMAEEPNWQQLCWLVPACTQSACLHPVLMVSACMSLCRAPACTLHPQLLPASASTHSTCVHLPVARVPTCVLHWVAACICLR